MPILIFLLVVLLIAQIGFWKTLGALLGGVAMFVILAALAVLTLFAVWRMAMRRIRGLPDRDRLPLR